MARQDLNDTIAAIATAVGDAGIGIVRISGANALNVADRVFFSKNKKRPSEHKTYTMHYGWVARDGDIIDEVILTIMRAPYSYTREDVVEINCHGGIVSLRDILDLVLDNGCRIAFPGEFTKRAFLNGRIDLSQAEAVLDVIKARTDSALKISVEQLKGSLSRRLTGIRGAILDLLSVLEADIDFPEDHAPAADFSGILSGLKEVDSRLKEVLSGADQGRIFREGISAVICGRTNVGKSSLLNALLKQERSIVTAVAGTTRDTIEEIIDIRGIPVRIVDTAGIISPRDLIERKAIRRTKAYIDQADLVILMFDGSRRLVKEDIILMNKLKSKTVLAVINKLDLKQKIDKERISRTFGKAIEISARGAKNIDALEEAIERMVYKGEVRSTGSVAISNLRHIQELKKTEKFIAEAMDCADNRLSAEFIAQDMKDAVGCLDDILGKRFTEELLNKIFSKFCIGK
ncbi:MAG: tRNA uridine-5-carboxymethylaminomethyl(34) synthesis GTPase MnmE [Candidatus Omnitrophica bacterium]|nr:tRNA uridine-5-carboxymethylaminomethyl(34) synthesis GTPase MnmE [Candidatus Omnitrophota bacterium]